MGEVIRARLAERPFVPFCFVLTGGTTHDVLEPDTVVVGADTVRLYHRAPNQPEGREWRAIISLPHVIAVKDAGDVPIVVGVGN